MMLVLWVGCKGLPDESALPPAPTDTAPTDSDTDTDTDTDSDTDVDTDTDADTDTDLGTLGLEVTEDDVAGWLDVVITVEGAATDDTGGAFAGEVLYRSTVADLPACDGTIGWSGAAYVGPCEGCDFAFEVSATLLEERGPACEDRLAVLTALPDGERTGPFVLSHRGSGTIFTEAGGYIPATDILELAYLRGGSPYAYPIAYAESPYGTFSDEGSLWTWTRTSRSEVQAGYDDCGAIAPSKDELPFYGPVYGLSTLDCPGSFPEAGASMDVWTFEGDPGRPVFVTVDTTSDDSAFDPVFFINGPDTCTVAFADDSFECAFAPINFSCPSIAFVPTTPGTHEVRVWSNGSCTGVEASYRIHIDTGA